MLGKISIIIRSMFARRKFKKCGKRLRIGKHCKIFNPKHIELGDNVVINDYHVFAPQLQHGKNKFNPSIIVGNNVNFGVQDRVACLNRVTIGNNVLIAAFVHITDHSHGYEDINIPISKQLPFSKGPVIIEDDCWLGFACHVLPGVTIGKHSVVAANSVVTKDVPPYSVVAGNPAKVIRRYNFEEKKWIKV